LPQLGGMGKDLRAHNNCLFSKISLCAAMRT